MIGDTALKAHLIRKGLRPYTIEVYLQRLAYLQKYVIPFTREVVEAFLVHKYELGVRASTLNKYIDIFTLYCDFNHILFEKIEHFKEETPIKDIYSDEEIETLIALPCPPHFRLEVWKKWSMWLQIIAFSGMRASEVSSLTAEQISWGTNNFILYKTKTTPRKVPIASILIEPLKKYVQGKSGYLFPSPTSRGHVWRQGWNKHLMIRLQYAGIVKRPGLTCHSFRHSFITTLIEEGASLPDIMQIVGQKRLDSIQKYIHLTNKSAQKAINRHRIIQKKNSPIDKFRQLVIEAEKAGYFNENEFEYVVQQNMLSIWVKGSKKEKITIEAT